MYTFQSNQKIGKLAHIAMTLLHFTKAKEQKGRFAGNLQAISAVVGLGLTHFEEESGPHSKRTE